MSITGEREMIEIFNRDLNTQKSTPIRCNGCNKWIYIYYPKDGSNRSVYSALYPKGVSRYKKWKLHRVENPSCAWYRKKKPDLRTLFPY